MPNICEIDFVALGRIFQIPQESKISIVYWARE